jgi:hypothetical protein
VRGAITHQKLVDLQEQDYRMIDASLVLLGCMKHNVDWITPQAPWLTGIGQATRGRAVDLNWESKPVKLLAQWLRVLRFGVRVHEFGEYA